MSTDQDLMDALRAADPLSRANLNADVSPGRLAGIRRIADARRGNPVASEGARRHPARRWLVLTGAATGLAALGTTILSLPAPDRAPSLAVTSVAVGADGSLSCDPPGGFTESIDPSKSAVRMLPTWLPEGWQVGAVWASEETGSTCYMHPSLIVADAANDGRVTRSAMVYGPIVEPVTVGELADAASTVTIAGQDGQLLVRRDPKGPSELVWLWADPSGAHWLMRSYGYEREAGLELAAALRPDDTSMGMDLAAAPAGTTVMHQRTGRPYPGRTTTHHWTLTLGRDAMAGRDGEVTIDVTGTPAGTFGLDGLFPDGMYVTGSGEDLTVHQNAHSPMSLYQPRPGTVITLAANQVTGGEPTLGSMTPEEWRQVITSLEQVPAAKLP